MNRVSNLTSLAARPLTLSIAAALAWPAAAFAQQAEGVNAPPATWDQDIVVTATRRSERLLDVPLSISALGTEQLRVSGASSAVEALIATPSVSISQQANSTLVTIRGVGLDSNNGFGESSVAQYIDGVYQPRPASINLAFADLERLEVLRGPQGTLYGRNATGGALNFISRQPGDEFEGEVDGLVGAYGTVKAHAVLSGPVGEGIGIRAVGLYDRYSGYGRNLFTGNRIGGSRSYGGRVILRAQPTTSLTVNLEGSYLKNNGAGDGVLLYSRGGEGNLVAVEGPGDNLAALFSPLTFGGGQATSKRFRVYTSTDPVSRSEQALGAATINWEVSDSLSIKSITGLQKNDTSFAFDLFPAVLLAQQPVIPIESAQTSDSFSQEIISNVNGFDGRLNLVVGGYYFHERFTGNNLFSFYGYTPTLVPLTRFAERTRSRALFADGTVSLTSQLDLTFGARATWERKDIDHEFDQNGPCAQSDFKLKYSNFSPKAGLRYKINDDAMAYFTYQKGFKAGGFNAYVCGNLYQPEKITSYEGGVKSSLFGSMLALSASIFHYDYTNLQVLFQEGTTNRINNAADSGITGGELEFNARPAKGLQIDGNVSLLKAKYKNFVSGDPLFLRPGLIDLSGNTLLRAPKFSGRLGIQQTFDIGAGDLMLRGEVQHTSRVYFGAFNRSGESQAAVTVLNAYAQLTLGQGWSARAFVKNITDRTIVTNASIVGSAASVTAGADPDNPNFPSIVGYAPPRTAGVGITKRF